MSSVFETRKVRVSLFGDLSESLAADQSLIEFRGQIGFLPDVFTLVIEFDLKLAADELERLLRVLLISQQRLPVLDLAHARCVLVPLDPGLQQLFDPIERQPPSIQARVSCWDSGSADRQSATPIARGAV